MNYRLAIYEDDELVALVHGALTDLTYIIGIIPFKPNMRFRVSSL